jgi:putative colanic acid biosynthesis glycosyltransferase
MNPRVSIVTVVFNGEEFLERSIESVICQTYANIEYIIVDGGSTDATVDLLNKYNSKISYWISEQDRGVYDAMNKAIEVAQGTWILFIGSDDYLHHKDVILDISPHLSRDSLMVYGNVEYTNGIKFNSNLTWKTIITNTVHHQACFYRRSLFNDFRYDSHLNICSDYELNLIAFMRFREKSHYVNSTISTCEFGGLSLRKEMKEKAVSEINLIRQRHVHSSIHLSVVFLIRFVQNLKLILSFSRPV